MENMFLPSRTPLPPPSPSHPSGLSQSTGFECPVSCIKLGLVICFTYDNIHVSMVFSQIIPSSPSPTESKSLFFTPVWRRQTSPLPESNSMSQTTLCPAHKSASGSPQISYFSGTYILLQNIYNYWVLHAL